MKTRSFALALTATAALLAGCAQMMEDKKPVAVVKDGELPLPADYKGWPRFLPAVQRPDAKQVREIYMNTAAKGGTAAKGFPNGTVFVMENYAAKAKADGTFETGPDGKLVKGDLLRVFVMGKNEGWGQDVDAALKNGNWVYSSFLPTGQKSPDNLSTCRACHVPLTQSKDFVHRYDEHFAQKAASLTHQGLVLALRSGAAAGMPGAAEVQRIAAPAR